MYLLLITGVIILLYISYSVFILQRPKYTGPIEKITIGRVKGYPDLALVAQHNNYFQENGLEITFKEYDKPAPLIQDILSSHIQLVSSTAEFLVVRSTLEGNPLKIISVVSTQDNEWEVIARKDKHIQTISDLQGKKIGTQYATIGGFLLGRFLTYYGIDTSTVAIEDLSRQEYTSKINSGDIDAVVTTSPFTKEIKQLLGSNAISWSAQPERSIYSVSYTSTDVIRKHPEVIARYLRALIQAQIFVKNHNNEAKRVMQKELQLSTSDMDDLWTKFSFEIKLPQELLITMEDETRWIIDNQTTNTTQIPNYLDAIYFAGLQTVKPEAITIFH